MAQKIKKSEAQKVIEDWFNLPRSVEKAKEWNKVLPYINAYPEVYTKIIETRKPRKEKDNDNNKQ